MYDKRYMVENFAKLCGENQRVVFSKATTLPKNRSPAKWHNRRPFDKEAPQSSTSL